MVSVKVSALPPRVGGGSYSSCNRRMAGRGPPSHHTQTANFIIDPYVSAAHSIKFVSWLRSGIYTLGGGAGGEAGLQRRGEGEAGVRVKGKIREGGAEILGSPPPPPRPHPLPPPPSHLAPPSPFSLPLPSLLSVR